MHDHDKEVTTVQQNIPSDLSLSNLAELFKVFGDRTRVKILFSLFDGELCVCAIAEVLNMSQSAISHQLKVLRDNNLIKNRREGKTIFYSLADEHVHTIIGQGFDHLNERD